MIQIALKMLLRDRKKYFILISAIVLSTCLVTIQTAIFIGSMRLINTLLLNTRAPIWVVSPQTGNVLHLIPLSDNEINAVRSVNGVKWAMPFFALTLDARTQSGEYTPIELVGVDTQSLFGIPTNVIKGDITKLWESDTVVVDEFLLKRFGTMGIHLDIGDFLLINDHTVKIVGVIRGEPPLFNQPIVYTTYSRAVEISPPVSKNLKAVLVVPREGFSVRELIKSIQSKTNLAAYTSDQLFWKSISWFFVNSALPVSFLVTCLIGLGVGILVASQTYYSFVEGNARNFAALKAMGATSAVEIKMLLSQIMVIGIVGYSIGIGISVMIIWWLKYKEITKAIVPWQLFGGVFIVIMVSLLGSATFAIRRVIRIQSVDVFHG